MSKEEQSPTKVIQEVISETEIKYTEYKKKELIIRKHDGGEIKVREIAQNILESARALDEYTASQGLDTTSFTQHTLPTLSGDLEVVRKKIVDSTTELKALVQGPIGQLYDVLFEVRMEILCNRGVSPAANFLSSQTL